MIRRLAPAEVSPQAWSDLAALPGLRAKREQLVDQLRTGCQNTLRGRARREALRRITADLLEREARLAAIGFERLPPTGTVLRPYTETEH